MLTVLFLSSSVVELLLLNPSLVAVIGPSVEIVPLSVIGSLVKDTLVSADSLVVIGPPGLIGLPCEVLTTSELFDDGSCVPGLAVKPGCKVDVEVVVCGSAIWLQETNRSTSGLAENRTNALTLTSLYSLHVSNNAQSMLNNNHCLGTCEPTITLHATQ